MKKPLVCVIIILLCINLVAVNCAAENIRSNYEEFIDQRDEGYFRATRDVAEDEYLGVSFRVWAFAARNMDGSERVDALRISFYGKSILFGDQVNEQYFVDGNEIDEIIDFLDGCKEILRNDEEAGNLLSTMSDDAISAIMRTRSGLQIFIDRTGVDIEAESSVGFYSVKAERIGDKDSLIKAIDATIDIFVQGKDVLASMSLG